MKHDLNMALGRRERKREARVLKQMRRGIRRPNGSLNNVATLKFLRRCGVQIQRQPPITEPIRGTEEPPDEGVIRTGYSHTEHVLKPADTVPPTHRKEF